MLFRSYSSGPCKENFINDIICTDNFYDCGHVWGACENTEFSGNVSSGNGHEGFHDKAGLFTHVHDNVFRGNDICVALEDAISPIVENNVCYENTSVAGYGLIHFLNTDNGISRNNTIYQSAGTGDAIYFDANSDNNVSINDKHWGAGASTITDLGTGNEIIRLRPPLVDVANYQTSNGDETDAGRVTIPAGTLFKATHFFSFRVSGAFGATDTAKTVKIYWGGTLIFTKTVSLNDKVFSISGTVLSEGPDTQKYNVNFLTSTVQEPQRGTAAVDDGANQILKLTIQSAAATTDVSTHYLIVEPSTGPTPWY